jgi:predicted branched-subunit amino acid permease
MTINQLSTAAMAGRGCATRTHKRRATLLDRDALLDVAPLLVALVPFAAIIGAQAAADGRAAGSLAGTLLLYAGSAQVSTLSLLHEGAGLASILVTVALINARFLAYSTVLAPRFAEQPTWFRLLAPHFVIDQTFAIVMARGDLTGRTRFRRYWLTSGLTIGLAWVAAMAAGATLGPVVPRTPALVMMPAAVLVAFLGRALIEPPAVVAGAVGVVAGLVPLPAGDRALLGTASGALAGFLSAKAARQ